MPTIESRILGEVPITIASGGARNIDCRGASAFTLITGAGATATHSKIDSMSATEHDAATDATQNADTDATIAVEWPFIRVSSAGGATRVALVFS